jgi:hypothetical protein
MFCLHQWYLSYEYPDLLNSDEDFVEFDSYLVPESDLEDGVLRVSEVDFINFSSSRSILPTFNDLNESLRASEPPKYTFSGDKDLFERLSKQKNSLSRNATADRSYISSKWEVDKVLDTDHKAKVLELAQSSGQLNTNGYHIAEIKGGQYKGEIRVCYHNSTANAKDLLNIINFPRDTSNN